MDEHELGNRLWAGRMSQRTLAAHLGISNQTVHRWVHGKEPIPEARAEQIDELLPPAQTEPAA